MRIMKNLVVSVSADSSLELLGEHADIVLLDKHPYLNIQSLYDTAYIRSHFSQQFMQPQNFRSEIESIVAQVKSVNPNVKFIDSMDNVDAIVAFEDKWHQYQIFRELMPLTELCDGSPYTLVVRSPVYKQRLSSRGSGVTWNKDNVTTTKGEWIAQNSLDIQEELRVYAINTNIHPTGIVKKSMEEGVKAEGTSARKLSKDEMQFVSYVTDRAPRLDIVGIDMARTAAGDLKLIEVNRSPGFAKFFELTGVNLANEIYCVK